MPPEACDFAALSFQVPTQLSPANAAVPAIHVATQTSVAHTSWFFRINCSPL
jgi:hypothetical protein